MCYLFFLVQYQIVVVFILPLSRLTIEEDTQTADQLRRAALRSFISALGVVDHPQHPIWISCSRNLID